MERQRNHLDCSNQSQQPPILHLPHQEVEPEFDLLQQILQDFDNPINNTGLYDVGGDINPQWSLNEDNTGGGGGGGGGDLVPHWPVSQDNTGGGGGGGDIVRHWPLIQDSNGGGGGGGAGEQPQQQLSHQEQPPQQEVLVTYQQILTFQLSLLEQERHGEHQLLILEALQKEHLRPYQEQLQAQLQLLKQQDHALLHHQILQQLQSQQQLLNVDSVAEDIVVAGNRIPHMIDQPIQDTGGIIGGVARTGIPQWTDHETREFIHIRAVLDKVFEEPSRRTNNQNLKTLWEEISNKMKEKGYDRSSKACKCKWETLSKRFDEIRSCQTVEAADKLKENFPFFDKFRDIVDARKQKGLLLGEGGGGPSGTVKKRGLRDARGDNEEGGVEKSKRKRASSSRNINSNLHEVLEGFVKHQMEWQKAWEDREEERRMKETEWREAKREREEKREARETEWREAKREREAKRKARETEWRERMEALERERLIMDRSWREREERETEWRQKMEQMKLDRLRKDKMIEEERAAKRDELIEALQQKLQR